MSQLHHCHAFECTTEVPPHMVMCGKHWRQVPARIQAAVWKYYRKGQEVDKKPSIQYIVAQRAAIWAVALKEERVTEIPNVDSKEFLIGPVRK